MNKNNTFIRLLRSVAKEFGFLSLKKMTITPPEDIGRKIENEVLVINLKNRHEVTTRVIIARNIDNRKLWHIIFEEEFLRMEEKKKISRKLKLVSESEIGRPMPSGTFIGNFYPSQLHRKDILFFVKTFRKITSGITPSLVELCSWSM